MSLAEFVDLLYSCEDVHVVGNVGSYGTFIKHYTKDELFNILSARLLNKMTEIAQDNGEYE